MGRKEKLTPKSSAMLGACLILLGLILLWATKKWQQPALDIPTFLSTAIGVVMLTDGGLRKLSHWRRARRSPADPTPDDVREAKEILARQITEQWKDAMRLLLLDDPRLIPVPWRSTQREELQDHPSLIAEDAGALTNRGDRIAMLADAFRKLRCKRLVILGDQGAGKTTLALQLLAELMGTRGPEGPVPVLLPAAGWTVEADNWGSENEEDKYVPLQVWLADYLEMEYPALRAQGLAPNLPQALASHGDVLPVLDALDEAPNEATMLKALRSWLDDPDHQLIVTCRTKEFVEAAKSAGDVLASATVIEPDPLPPGAVADYLEESFYLEEPHPPQPPAPWRDILAELREGRAPALAEITSKPLGLWLVREVYVSGPKDAKELQRLGEMADPQPLRDHLCDELIPALINLHPHNGDTGQPFRPLHTLEAGQVRDWLAYLSRHTSKDSSPHDVAWWQMACNPHSLLIPWGVAALCGLVVGLTLGLLQDPALGTTVGVASGVLLGFKIRSWFKEQPGYANFHIQNRLPYLMGTMGDALCVVLVGAMVGWLQTKGELKGTITLALVCGLGYEFTVGLMRWVEQATENSTARSPSSTWKDDMHLTLIRIASGLVIGLVASYIGWRHGMIIPTAVVGGTLVGLIFGLILGSHHAWLAYHLTIPRLATRRWLPLRTMSFLEDAHRVGLLRIEGPYYQFRDTLLQEHLAEHHQLERPCSCHPRTRKREDHN
ncbi:hypothetical protein [Nonomuraea sp. NPDC048901]|uniref:hypothetical protein n=1 Tax=Nonomuraea sp. NPDC048901 TaxID=3155627 RepID=UPI0033C905F4